MEKINLDKEFFDWYQKESVNDYNASTLYEKYGTISKKLAKYFFELGLKQKENRDMMKIPKSLKHILNTPEKIADLEKGIIAFREWAQKECQQWSEHVKAKGE